MFRMLGIWAAILAVAALLSSATGFRLVHEEFRSTTSKTGAKLHYRVNPDVEDAIKVEAIHRSHLNYPRGSHPAAAEMHFRDQIGGTTAGYYGKPRSVHGEVWSLLSNGRVEHARDLHKAVMEEDHHEVHIQRMGVRRSNNRDSRRQHETARTRFKETAANFKQQSLRTQTTQNPCQLEKGVCDQTTGCDWLASEAQCVSSADASLKEWDQPASEPPANYEWRCRYRCGRQGQNKCGDPVNLDSETACRQLGCGHRECLLVAAGHCDIQKKTAKLACYTPLEKGNDEIGKEAHYDPKVDPKTGPEIIAGLSATGMKPHQVYRDIPPSDFWTEALDDLHKSNLLAPNINAYACVELDMTLPGIQLQFGLMGAMALDTGTGCWTLTIEGSFGVFFGVQVLSLSIGINIHVAGTFSMTEIPGDDGQCVATSNPFSIITETGEMLKTALSKDERVKKKLEESLEKLRTSDAYKGFDDYKTDGSVLPIMKVEAPQAHAAEAYGVVQDKLLRRSIVAVYKSWPWVEEKIMKYATQALDMLVDIAPGQEPTAYYAKAGAGRLLDSKDELDAKNDPVNYNQNTGRFLARKLSSVTKEQKAKAYKDNTKINIFDDRVHNFPASARLSEWNGNPYFWREYAISGANLFIRIVKDLQAVFNSYVFGQAEWDGDCDSLPAKFYPVDESEEGVPTKRTSGKNINEDGESPFSDHHWASPFKADSRKLDSGKRTAAFWKTAGLKSWGKVHAAIYPHVLCQSFKISTESSATDKDFMNSAKSSSKICEIQIKKSDKAVTCKATADCPNWRGGPDAVECSSAGQCVCKAGFCTRDGTCMPSGRAQPILFDEKAFVGAKLAEKQGVELSADEMAKWKLARDGVDLFFPKARDIILGGEKVTHLEYETASLKGVFITAFPRLAMRMMELYVKISEHLQIIDKALCEHHISEGDFDKQLNDTTTQEQVDKLLKKVATHLPARYQHQFAALVKKGAELTANTPKTRFRSRRRQADGHASGDAASHAGPGTGDPFPPLPTGCEDGSAPNPTAVSASAILIVDHVRTFLLQLSTKDFTNAESIWQGDLKVQKWYERMSDQPAALPGKGQTYMPDLLLRVLKEQVSLVPEMRQDWTTAFKVESAGKKCCVRDAMMKAECGIFNELSSCPEGSRWQRDSAMGDLGSVDKKAEGGCCGPKMWVKQNKFKECKVIGCVVKDDIEPTHGMGGEKVLLMGTHFQGISKALKYMQKNVEAYKTHMEENAVAKMQSDLLNAVRAPIVEYSLTFTVDIESSPPGFCTPSSSLLQVVGSVSWSGRTDSSEPMTMQACVAARVHPPDFYFMLSFCLQDDTDLADSTGNLDSIDAGKNGAQQVRKHSAYKVSVNVFAYLAKASPLAPDPNLMAMVEPLKNLFFTGGPSAIAGALGDSAASGAVPSISEGLMKIAMAAPTVGVTSALMREPSPLDDLGSAIGAVGMSLSVVTVFVQGMLLSIASGGLESASDYLTVDPASFLPAAISLDMELVSDSAVEFEFTWRACRHHEISADIDACTESKGTECSEQAKTEIRDTCTRLVRPLKKTCELHIASWNRLAVTFVSPIPFGALKIQPLFGLEIDFDFTPLWEIMENHGRSKYNQRRQQACAKCLTTKSQQGKFLVKNIKFEHDIASVSLNEEKMGEAIAKHLKIPASNVQVAFKKFAFKPTSTPGENEGYLCCVREGYTLISSDVTFVPKKTQLCSTGESEEGNPWLEFNSELYKTMNGGKTHTCCKPKLFKAAAKGSTKPGTADMGDCVKHAEAQLTHKLAGDAVYQVSIIGAKPIRNAAKQLGLQTAIAKSFAPSQDGGVPYEVDKLEFKKEDSSNMAFCDSRNKLTNWQPSEDYCKISSESAKADCTKEMLYGTDAPNFWLINHLIDLHTPPVWIDMTSEELCMKLAYKRANSDEFAVEWIANDASMLRW